MGFVGWGKVSTHGNIGPLFPIRLFPTNIEEFTDSPPGLFPFIFLYFITYTYYQTIMLRMKKKIEKFLCDVNVASKGK